MASTDMEPAKPAKLGAIGMKLRTMTNDVLAEIETTWDEHALEVIRANGEEYAARAAAVKITNQAEYDAANALFLSGASYRKKGGELLDPFVETTRAPYKTMTDIRKLFLDQVVKAEAMLEQKIVTWRMAEKRRIAAEQDRLDAERRAKEAEDRRKAQDEERKAREKAEQIKRDADAKAAELQAQAEAAAAAGREEEARKLAAQAQKTTDKGAAQATKQEAKAEQAAATAASVYTPPTILQDTVKKTETTDKGSIPAIKTWKVSIKDELGLVCGVARNAVLALAPVDDPAALQLWVLKEQRRSSLPITCLNMDLTRAEAGIRRWAEVQKIQHYADNGIEVDEWENLQGRTSTKAKKEGAK